MDALSMVNRVQRELRLPLSTAITDSHAQLILSYLNKVQRKLMTKAAVWDELKVYGDFATAAGTATYTTSSASGDIDVIRNLQIGNDDPLALRSDGDFREYKRNNTSQAQPVIYRHYARSGGSMVIEVAPVPDAIYTIDTEVLVKPPELVNSTDVPLLDAEIIVLGGIALALDDQGEDNQTELAAFQSALGLHSETEGDSNWGDVEAV